MRILLIEDDLAIGRSLVRALEDAAFSVDWVREGEKGIGALKVAEYTVALLDLGLPDLGGLEVLQKIRRNGSNVPLLILTAQDGLNTRVMGLDLGADDYVCKPFDVPELLARIRAVLRRKAGYAVSTLGDGNLSLDLERKTLTYQGITAVLPAREFALMHTLIERPNIIFSRSQLEDRLYSWGNEVESNAVDVLIHSVRKKFGYSIIRNVRGLGWTVVLEAVSRQP